MWPSADLAEIDEKCRKAWLVPTQGDPALDDHWASWRLAATGPPDDGEQVIPPWGLWKKLT